jgi:hypothetical protein
MRRAVCRALVFYAAIMLTWGAIFTVYMLGHRSRGGEKDESAHGMQHVSTAGGCLST